MVTAGSALGQYYKILNPVSNLVLDAKKEIVAIQQYTGSPLQKWELISIGKGKFNIRNAGNR